VERSPSESRRANDLAARVLLAPPPPFGGRFGASGAREASPLGPVDVPVSGTPRLLGSRELSKEAQATVLLLNQ